MDEQTLARLWAKFATQTAVDIDHRKFAPFIEAEARAVLAEQAANGLDPMGYIEANEDGFLEEVARRTRERLSDIGVHSPKRTGILADVEDWQAKFRGRAE